MEQREDGTKEPKPVETPAEPTEPAADASSSFDDIMAMMGSEETPPAETESPPAEGVTETPKAVQADAEERKAPGKEVAEPVPLPEPAAPTPPEPGATAQPPAEPEPAPVEPKPAGPVAVTPDVEGERAKRIEAIKTKREETRQLLENQYMDRITFTEEETAQLLVEPEKVLKGKLARLSSELFLDVFESLQRTNWAAMPHLVRGEVTQQRAARETEQVFYTKWPALNKPEYVDTIRQVGEIHRRQNPKATRDQSIDQVGAMVSVSLGIPIPGYGPVKEAAPETPHPKPFTPASPGGTGESPTPETPANEWETFGQEIERLG